MLPEEKQRQIDNVFNQIDVKLKALQATAPAKSYEQKVDELIVIVRRLAGVVRDSLSETFPR